MASRFNRAQVVAVMLASSVSAGVLAQQATQSGIDASRSGTQAQAVSPVTTSAVPADQSLGAIISPRDKISITTVGEPLFSVQAIVDADGTFDFGHLGRIKAGGLTVRQLEDDIKTRLVQGGFLSNPEVTIELVQSATKHVMVNGSVRNPQNVPFAGKMTVMEALVDVGSLAPDAGDRAFIIRGNPDGSLPSADQMTAAAKTYVDLQKLIDDGDLSQNFALNDGDYLYVEKAQPFTIDGEVKSPGQYPAHRGLTVQQAVALAGGLTDKGKDKGIKILRPTADPKKPRTIEVKDWATEQVKPGDTIMVPRRLM